MTPLRLVFLGSDPIALPMLNWLCGEGASLAQVVGVFTQPDRPVGRGQQVVANAIKLWALEKNLPVLQPDHLTDAVRLQLAAFTPDVSLVMAYGHILREPFIATPRLGTLNLHASILPKFRGASPIQTAIATGEVETGVSLMRIVRRLDAGPVAEIERVPIAAHDTAEAVEQKLAHGSIPLLQRGLPAFAAETLEFTEQNEALASYCRRLSKPDGGIDFRTEAREIASRINGLYPWPGCTIEIHGQPIKIGLAEFEPAEHAKADFTPGQVRSEMDQFPGRAAFVRVAAKSGVVRLLRLQRPGGKMLSAAEFLRGFPIPAGTILPSKEMLPLVSTEPFPYRK